MNNKKGAEQKVSRILTKKWKASSDKTSVYVYITYLSGCKSVFVFIIMIVLYAHFFSIYEENATWVVFRGVLIKMSREKKSFLVVFSNLLEMYLAQLAGAGE